MVHFKESKRLKSGGAGYRSRYLSHAKRALYHLSYAPIWINRTSLEWRFEGTLSQVSNSSVTGSDMDYISQQLCSSAGTVQLFDEGKWAFPRITL